MISRATFDAVHRRLVALRRGALSEVEDTNRLIYHVLRGGILVSVGLIVLGFVASLAGAGPLPETPVPFRGLAAELRSLTPAGLLSLGVLVLVMTPIARVLASLLSFAKDRVRLYVLVTGIVLANLLVSLLLGAR